MHIYDKILFPGVWGTGTTHCNNNVVSQFQVCIWVMTWLLCKISANRTIKSILLLPGYWTKWTVRWNTNISHYKLMIWVKHNLIYRYKNRRGRKIQVTKFISNRNRGKCEIVVVESAMMHSEHNLNKNKLHYCTCFRIVEKY